MKKMLIVGLGAVFWGCLPVFSDGLPHSVRIVEAVERQERPVKRIPGRAVAVADVRVVPLVRGRIVEVAFRNGSSVKAGDLLYRIDPGAYQARLNVAEARAEVLRVKAKNAQRNYERRKAIVGRGVSQEDVENSMADRDSAAAVLKEAEAALDIARADLANCMICAPISGIVGTSAKAAGDYVGDSTPLVDIVQTSPMRVGFALSNGEFLRMFGGRSDVACSNAVVRLSLSDGTVFPEEGTLDYLENSIDAGTDSIRMYASFCNEAGLIRRGGAVSVALSDRRPRKGVAVPLEAVRVDSKGTYVWGVDSKGAAVRRDIVCGRLDGDFRFVFSGVSAGDRVLIDRGSRVVEGTIVADASGEMRK